MTHVLDSLRLETTRTRSTVGGGSLQALAPQQLNRDPLMRFLFAPEVVMSRQGQIGLQDTQRARLVKEMAQAQARFTEIQWSLSAAQEKLQLLVQANPVEEGAALRAMDQVLAMEHELKRTQMTLLVRVKNILTAEQQAILAR